MPARPKGDITESIDVVGSKPNPQQTSLGIGGIVKPFDLKIGNLMEKGDVLMSLDESSLSSFILCKPRQILSTVKDTRTASIEGLIFTLHFRHYPMTNIRFSNTATNRAHWNVKDRPIHQQKQAFDYYAAKELMYEKDNAYQVFSDRKCGQ